MNKTNQKAQAFRWGQMTSGLESAQASLKLALRASDLLSPEANKRLHDVLDTLCSIEQQAWVIYNSEVGPLVSRRPPAKRPAARDTPKRRR